MKLTYFANWKSCLRTLVLTMMVIVAVLAVKPATVQAKASDYTQDTEGWIEACQKVGRDLTKYNFTYGSHNKPTLSASIKHGRKANCASYVSWCLQEFGVLKKGKTFYTRGGRIHKRFKSWRGKVQIIKVNKKLTDVNLQPGDIIGWRDIVHTNIYVGKNGKGQKLWLDGGSAGTRRGRVRRYYSADKIKTFSYLNKHKVSFIIRIKGL